MDWEGLGAVKSYVAAAIREAAELIQENGWVQGRFVGDDGAVDVLQALGLACGLDVSRSHRRDVRLPAGSCVLLGAVLDEVGQRVSPSTLSVWNDLPDQTADTVCAALAEAAGALE